MWFFGETVVVSGKKWLIIGLLALADIVVLCLVVSLIRSYTNMLFSPPPTIASIPTVSTAALPPTWTPVPTSSPAPTPTRRPTHTPTDTATPWPTFNPSQTPSPTPLPSPTLASFSLENPTFDYLGWDYVPGWHTGGVVNWAPGQPFDVANSYAAPRFHRADDPRQWINGSTLQIDTEPWVKLRAWVFQTVTVTTDSRVQFQIHAMGFVKETAGGYILKAGIDPSGGEGCDAALWGTEQIVNQDDGVILLSSPEVVVGEAGRVTVCAFAETQFAQVYHAAFFDDAALLVTPPGHR